MNQYELISKVAKYGYKAFGLKAPNLTFLLTLLSYYNYQTKECYPSNESVERGCGINPDNLHRHKKVLVAAGIIKTYDKKMGDKKSHSGYIINTDFLEEQLAIAEQADKEAEIVRARNSDDDILARVEVTEEDMFGSQQPPEPTISAFNLRENLSQFFASEPVTASRASPQHNPLVHRRTPLESVQEAQSADQNWSTDSFLLSDEPIAPF